MPTAPVTAVIPIMDPNREHLARTLASLARQNSPPAEVIIVDSTPGGFHVGEGGDGDCGVCGDPVVAALDALHAAGVSTSVVHNDEAGIGGARRAGLHAASSPVVWHMDEDSVILSNDWTEVALDRLEEDGIVGVGGAVIQPVDKTRQGKVIARLGDALRIPPEGHNIMHPRMLCAGDRCFEAGQNRGEDITLRRQLRRHGRVVRESSLVCEKAFPTRRQELGRNIGGATAAGAALPLAAIALLG